TEGYTDAPVRVESERPAIDWGGGNSVLAPRTTLVPIDPSDIPADAVIEYDDEFVGEVEREDSSQQGDSGSSGEDEANRQPALTPGEANDLSSMPRLDQPEIPQVGTGDQPRPRDPS
ncbi:MAG: hypothetical protein ACR2NP_10930, partial [Pirellulaceae bacterium]